jgi:DNA invertase Pin-like site-specific DNA recombinase
MKLAGYLRVSTDRQADEGLGLDVQRQAIKAWAKANHHRLVVTFSDEGISGAKELDHRPGLADALDALRSRSAHGLVVYRLDRLARDLVLQEQLLVEIRRLGGELHSTSAAEAGYLADDPDDPTRKLIRHVLGAVAEYERAMIALRLRSGRRRKAEKGGFAFGSPAFGYRAADGALAPDPAEQATVARIAELHASGASLRTIADTLADEGHRPKRGDRWHPQTLARIVHRITLPAMAEGHTEPGAQ